MCYSKSFFSTLLLMIAFMSAYPQRYKIPMLRPDDQRLVQMMFPMTPHEKPSPMRETTAVGGETNIYYSNFETFRYGSNIFIQWTCNITLDEEAGTATFDNLCGFVDKIGTYNVTLPYQDGEITINTYTPDVDINNVTVGYEELGMKYYMAGGTLSDGEIILDREVKLYVSEDKKTISTHDKALLLLADYTMYGMGMYNTGNTESPVVFHLLTGGTAHVLHAATAYDFGTLFPNQKSYQKITLESVGSEAVDYSFEFDNPAFSVTENATGTVQPLKTTTVEICFNPKTIGDYSGKMTVNVADTTYIIDLSGECLPVSNDMDDLVIEGPAGFFAWNNEVTTYPWLMTGNVCHPSNKFEYYTNSILDGTYTCEKPYELEFDYSTGSPDYLDTLSFYVDGIRQLAYIGGETDTYRMQLPAGTHTVRWQWYTRFHMFTSDNVYFGNIRLKEMTDPYVGLNPDGRVTFTSCDFLNLNGQAHLLQPEGSIVASIAADTLSSLTFDYEITSAESTISVQLTSDQTYTETISGKKGTYHLDFSPGTGIQNLIITGTQPASAHSGIHISNIRVAKGAYKKFKRIYRMISVDLLDGYSRYSPDGMLSNYTTTVTFTTDCKVLLEGLVPPSNAYWPNTTPIVGTVIGNEIHIPTVRSINHGTLYGWDNKTYEMNNEAFNRYWLVAGSLDDAGDHQERLDELVFTISPDSLTLTAQQGFGIFRTWSYYDETMISFMDAGAKLTLSTEEVKLSASVDTLDFGTLDQGVYEVKRPFGILNNSPDTDFSVEIVNDDNQCLTVTPMSGSLLKKESVLMTVKLDAQIPGQLDAQILIHTAGQTLVIPVLADIHEGPDYTRIMAADSEEIEWYSSSKIGWQIVEADGLCYAKNGNKDRNNTNSALTASLYVPNGYVGILSADANCNNEGSGDIYSVALNGHKLLSYVSRNDYASFSLPLPGTGYQEVTFDYTKNENEDNRYLATDEVHLWNVKFELKPKKGDCAALLSYDKNFFDVVPVGDVAAGTVYLVNEGTNKLSLLGAEPVSGFSAVIPADNNVAPGDTMAVQVLFSANEPGEYNGDLVLNTTAGDFPVQLNATADYVRYLAAREARIPYGPIALYYLYYPSVKDAIQQTIYPASMLEGLEGCELTSMTFFSSTVHDVDFTGQDVRWQLGETEELNVTEDEAAGLTDVYRGEQVDLNGFELTVPFTQNYVYQGGNLHEQLIVHHGENWGGYYFYFWNGRSDEPASMGMTGPYGLDTLAYRPFMRLKYIPKQEESIDRVSDDLGSVLSVAYTGLDGQPRSAIQPGMNIVTVTYSNGIVKSYKQFCSQNK